MKGTLVIGHGSRSKDAREAFYQIVEQLKADMNEEVEGCFMEISEPFIPETIEIMYKQGVRELTVLPYFLFNGIHIKEDIPEILHAARAHYPDLVVSMAQPIGYHEALVEILKERLVGELLCI
jgi:sirohydrochlorin cobaltochelatase